MDARLPEPNPTHFLHPGTLRHPWPRVGLLRSRPDLIPRLCDSRFLPDTVHDNPSHSGARHQRPCVGSSGLGCAARKRSDHQSRFVVQGTSPPLLSHTLGEVCPISTLRQGYNTHSSYLLGQPTVINSASRIHSP